MREPKLKEVRRENRRRKKMDSSPGQIGDKSIPGRGHSLCKGPEGDGCAAGTVTRLVGCSPGSKWEESRGGAR